MKYRELFHIEIIHPYFLDIPKDMILVAEIETKKKLKKLGYILKKTANGAKILIPTPQEDNSFLASTGKDKFTFHVFPTSSYIQEITDFSAIDRGNMISFFNDEQQVNSSGLNTTQVHQNGICYGFPAIAEVVISMNKIDVNKLDQPIKFNAVFKAKSIKWKYYFVSDSQTLNILVESRDTQISFDEVIIDNATTDPVIQSLQLNFPNSQIRAFESRDLVPYSSKPLKNIKLLQNEDVLINHLPNPQEQQQGIQIIKIK